MDYIHIDSTQDNTRVDLENDNQNSIELGNKNKNSKLLNSFYPIIVLSDTETKNSTCEIYNITDCDHKLKFNLKLLYQYFEPILI